MRIFGYVIRDGITQILKALLEMISSPKDFCSNDGWHHPPMDIAAFNQDHGASPVLRCGVVTSQAGNVVIPLQIACRDGSRKVSYLFVGLREVDDL